MKKKNQENQVINRYSTFVKKLIENEDDKLVYVKLRKILISL